MTFEFTVHPDFNFLTSFSQKFKIPVYKNRITIPASLGKGYIKKIDIETSFKLIIHHYTLKEDFHLKRVAPKESNTSVSIIFNSTEIPTNIGADKQSAIHFLKNNGAAIQIASGSLGTENFFPANKEVFFFVIGITSDRLSALLHIERSNDQIKTILSHAQLFFYHESMTPEMQRIIKQISEINDQDKLKAMYYTIKIQELLYLLFSKLVARETEKQNRLNKTDVDSLYAIRAAIVSDLSLAPHLPDLAKMAGMGETKMKHVFKQIFGDTIYNYYQKARMEEAAFLLKHTGRSVSEIGYQLGFSNLSHFSRVFEKQYNTTPKKFMSAG